MVDAALFSSQTGEWETPQDRFDEWDKEFRFTLDAAATRQNAKCRRWYTMRGDALAKPWPDRVWLNPPYGRGVGQWVEKARRESLKGSLVVCLLPARTDTRWFHDHVWPDKAEVRFLKGRLRFGGSKNPAPFPSMLVIFHPYGRPGQSPDATG